jgi:hypothetical protein
MDRRATQEMPPLSFAETNGVSLGTGGINWYRNITRNWENAAGRD